MDSAPPQDTRQLSVDFVLVPRGNWHQSERMSRFLPASLTAFLLICPLIASVSADDRKLMDRIDNPDMEKVFDASTMTYGGGTAFATKEFQTKSAYVKEFYFVDRVRTKEFATNASQFSGQTASAEGQQFTTREVSENLRNAHSSSEQTYATSNYETREIREAAKVAPTEAYETRDYEGRGTRQRELDAQTKAKGNLTIDEVREILNKSR